MNVSSLGLGNSIRVADLPRGGKLKFITDESATVAHIVAIKEEVAPVVDAVVAAAPAEPEVAKKGKIETLRMRPPKRVRRSNALPVGP